MVTSKGPKPTPKHLGWKIGGGVVAGLLLLGMCATDSDKADRNTTPAATPATTTTTPPRTRPYTLTVLGDGHLDVGIESVYLTSDLEQIVDELHRKYVDQPDGYFVTFTCAAAGTVALDNVIANAKFAIGAIGAAITGLPAGGSEVVPVPGAKCPPEPVPVTLPVPLLPEAPPPPTETSQVPPPPPPTPPPTQPQPYVPPPASSVYYSSCADARAAGAAPLHQGDPGYRSGLDRDGDGIACDA